MNHFQLPPALMTGHPVIDAEHAHLVALLNQLIDLSEVDDDDGCAEKMGELTEALIGHLENEEKIMAGLKFYKPVEHKETHSLAFTKYEMLITGAERSGYGRSFTTELASLLLDGHIREDMIFKSYLQIINYQPSG